jgi:hypothetical protein
VTCVPNDFELLADELVTAYRNHESLAHIYYLLAKDHGTERAHREFVRFLRGERCEPLLELARTATATRTT